LSLVLHNKKNCYSKNEADYIFLIFIKYLIRDNMINKTNENYGSIESDSVNKPRPSSSQGSQINKNTFSKIIQRPFTALPSQFSKRPNTGVEFNKHYSYKSIYSNLSANHAVKRKVIQFRSKSSVNFVKRPISTYSIVKKNGQSPVDTDDEDGKFGFLLLYILDN